MFNALYILESDTKSEDDAMWVDSNEEPVSSAFKMSASIKELERTGCMCVNVKQICKEFEASVVMGSDENRATPKQNAKREKVVLKKHYKWMLPCFDA